MKEELSEIFAPEPLDPELAANVFKVESSGLHMLDHELVRDVPYSPSPENPNNRFLNRFFAHKKKALKEALEQKDWSQVIYLHERPYRIIKLYFYANEMTPQEYWPLLADVWADSESIRQVPKNVLYKLWHWFPGERIGIMSAEEKSALDAMPETFQIYRSYRPNGAHFSWSLNKDVAYWFANRRHAGRKKTRKIHLHIEKGMVKRSDVWAYLTDRSEEEIVVERKKVSDVEIESIEQAEYLKLRTYNPGYRFRSED